jgi:formate dehydrogenase subunit delta
MNINQLIKMANQIGSFFEAMPDHQEALAGIAKHLKDFWDPRMRKELLAYFDSNLLTNQEVEQNLSVDDALSLIVSEAILQHRKAIMPNDVMPTKTP